MKTRKNIYLTLGVILISINVLIAIAGLKVSAQKQEMALMAWVL